MGTMATVRTCWCRFAIQVETRREAGRDKGRKERWRGEKQGGREERGEAAEKVRDGQRESSPKMGRVS